MWAYLVRRVLAFIPTIFVVVTIVFVLTRLVPGDPAWVLAGHQLATEERVTEIRKELGLDQPVFVQYVRWLCKALKGDFGTSIFLNRPVAEVVVERLPVTLSLALLATVITLIISFCLGTLAAVRRNTLTDAVTMTFSIFGVSLPSFWLGFLCILLFAVTLKWLPTSGYRSLLDDGFVPWIRHIILPVCSLCLAEIALLTRITRASLLEVLGREYIVTARAKGLSQWVVLSKHAFRNALITIITVAGLSFAVTLGGSIIIESVFALPGVGSLIISAAVRRDYPVIQGVVFYLIGISLLVNLFVDISYTLINPRITY